VWDAEESPPAPVGISSGGRVDASSDEGRGADAGHAARCHQGAQLWAGGSVC